MKRVLVIALLSLPLSACYTTDPALTGPMLVAATARRSAASHRRGGGALVGGAVGATTGAVIGAAASPRPMVQCEYDPYSGQEVCYQY